MIITFALLALLAQSPTTAEPREPLGPLTHAVIIANVTMHFADVTSSAYAFGYNRGNGKRQFREANRLLAWAEDDPAMMAVMKATSAVLQTYAIIHIHKKRPKLAVAAGVASTVFTAFVVRNNLRVLSRLDK